MEFLLLLFLIVAVVWLAIAFAMWRARRFPVSFLLGGLAVLISGSILGYEFFNVPSGIPLTIDRAIWGALCGAFILSVFHGRVTIQVWDRMDLLILVLLAILTLSTGLHDWGYRGNLPLSRLLFLYVMPIGLYFLVKHAQITNRDLTIVGCVFALFGVYLGLIGIAENRGWYGLIFPTYIHASEQTEFLGRARGPFLNPVSNGLFLVTSLAIVWSFCVTTKIRGRSLVILGIPIMLVGVLFTLTRSVWMGALFGAGFLVWVPSQMRQRGLMIAAGGLAALILVSSLGQSLISFKRDKDVSISEMSKSASLRPIFARVAVEMCKDRPLWGFGFGQYSRHRAFYAKQFQSGSVSILELEHAIDYYQHNVFLSYLVDTGLLGMGWLMLMLGNMVLIGIELWKNRLMSKMARQMGLVLIVLVANYCINGMFHDVSLITMGNTLLFFIAGVTSNLHRQGRIVKLNAALGVYNSSQPQVAPAPVAKAA